MGGDKLHSLGYQSVVIRSIRQRGDAWRHVLLTLAMLAVALKVLIPPGFMAGKPTNDAPFALVLCTGQGAVVVQPGEALPSHEDTDKSPTGSAHDSPCVFASHNLAAALPSLSDAGALTVFAYHDRPQAILPDLAPGRGLTGPPLPARGPPSRLI